MTHCPSPDMIESRITSEQRLISRELDFSATYMTVKHLVTHIQSYPESITDQTIQALDTVISSPRFDSQRQVLFLFREAAQALVSVLGRGIQATAQPIIPRLQDILSVSSDARHRAVAETLSALPLEIRGPENAPLPETDFREISFNQLISTLNVIDADMLSWQGRSLTGPTRDRLLAVIKFIRADEDPLSVTRETGWMSYFRILGFGGSIKCDIPEPVRVDNLSLLKIVDCPETLVKGKGLHPERFVIAFKAPEDYYRYPNGNPCSRDIPGSELKEMICRNAWLLGRAVSRGIIHTAPVPLFHNRVQQNRRNDGGFYEWQRGGRLDQWLESCRHPNFAASGLRDFEHFETIRNLKELGHPIGSHLLSLILVTGSYFRNQEPDLKGRDASGAPLDTRHLFDRTLFNDIIETAMAQYYHGFTGIEPQTGLLSPPANLLDSLIDHMGVDIHMEEVLRIEDQNRMGPDTFEAFLVARGFTREHARNVAKGVSEITLLTGPHLGGFNQRISVPELIEFIFSCSALCISGRYAVENGLKQSPNCDIHAGTAD
ncbi:MAG: SidJ-related pseudokinase [Pseudomonadota bacterium]